MRRVFGCIQFFMQRWVGLWLYAVLKWNYLYLICVNGYILDQKIVPTIDKYDWFQYRTFPRDLPRRPRARTAPNLVIAFRCIIHKDPCNVCMYSLREWSTKLYLYYQKVRKSLIVQKTACRSHASNFLLMRLMLWMSCFICTYNKCPKRKVWAFKSESGYILD